MPGNFATEEPWVLAGTRGKIKSKNMATAKATKPIEKKVARHPM
ncbi:unknown [Sutterella sp. CAG:521]|nr:unknown [Sutterella sp. CAG:521]